MPIYNKLVRDKIPEVIAENDQQAKIRILDDDEFAQELEKKLQEEVAEYLEDKTTGELADIMEVVYALAELQGYTPSQLERIRTRKANERGVFEKKLFLVSVDD